MPSGVRDTYELPINVRVHLRRWMSGIVRDTTQTYDHRQVDPLCDSNCGICRPRPLCVCVCVGLRGSEWGLCVSWCRVDLWHHTSTRTRSHTPLCFSCPVSANTTLIRIFISLGPFNFNRIVNVDVYRVKRRPKGLLMLKKLSNWKDKTWKWKNKKSENKLKKLTYTLSLVWLLFFLIQ